MKQFALTLCMVLLSVMFCRAQIKPLKFDKNGEFKIVQFTDVHFKYGNPASDIVNPEKPDVPPNKNDAFQKVQKRRVQEKR